MHDVVGFLKEVAQKNSSRPIEGCYVIQDGHIYCTNMSMTAGVPWDAGADFILFGEAVDIALSRMKSVEEIRIDDQSILIRGGRLRSTLRKIDTEAPGIPSQDIPWTKGVAGLTAAMDVARPFMGDQRWTMGMRLWQDRITASNGNALVDIKVPKLDLERAYLITEDVVKFVVAQGDPDEIAPEDDAFSFRWADGRWVRARLLDDVMPEENVERIFAEKVGTEAPIEITADFKAALEDAVALGDGVLQLTAGNLQAVRENVVTEIEIKTKLPDDHSSFWSAKSMVAMTAVAKQWNPEAWPNPAFFLGGGLRGAITGMSKR